MNYKNEIQEIHNRQSQQNGFAGKTDVELANEIFLSIDSFFAPEDKDKIVYIIANSLEKHRTY